MPGWYKKYLEERNRIWAGQSFGHLESDGWRRHLQKYFVVRISEQKLTLVSLLSLFVSLSLSSLSFWWAGEMGLASPAILHMGIQGGIMERNMVLKPEE